MRHPLLVALLALAAPAMALADEPKIYLSWGAPHGLPGASTSLSWTGGDTTRVDTLFLSFDPGKDTTLVGGTLTVWFRALSGDSLSLLWQSAGGLNLPSGMKFEFANTPVSGHPFPWESFGIGDFGYTRPGRTVGQVRALFAVAASRAARVQGGKLYGLARLLLRRPPGSAPGSSQSVCVEWANATLAFAPGREPQVNEGITYAGINATGGERGCGVPTNNVSAASGKPKSKKTKKP
jgi:hypothetical protein